MYVFEVATGLFGGFVFLMATVLAYKTHKNFQENAELAATKISLKNSITRSLQVMVIGTLFFGITGLTSLLTIVNQGNMIFANSYRLGTIIIFITYLYMILNIQTATEKQQKSKEDDSTYSITFN